MTKVFNIDALLPAAEFSMMIEGKKHDMKVQSVEDMLVNLRELEDLAENPSLAKELNVMVGIVGRAFPTVTEEQIRRIPATLLGELFEFVRNGGKEDKGGEGNAPSES